MCPVVGKRNFFCCDRPMKSGYDGSFSFDVVYPTRCECAAVQTALMSFISVDNWTMFQAPESRERVALCTRWLMQ